MIAEHIADLEKIVVDACEQIELELLKCMRLAAQMVDLTKLAKGQHCRIRSRLVALATPR